MIDLFLLPHELVALTGYKRGAEQIAWLKARRWLHETTAAGAPRVARAYFERRLVGQATASEPPAPTRHDFGALQVVK